MSSTFKPVCFLLLAFLYLPFTIAQFSSCSGPFNELIKQNNISNCKKLATLGAEFGWNYHQIKNKTTQIDFLFGVKQQHNDDLLWIAWGLNPGNRPQMVGTRAIIGIIQKNGTISVKTYNITSNTKRGCELMPSNIEFEVIKMKGEASNSNNSGYMTISGTLFVSNEIYDIMRLNHVWQAGYNADQENLEPKMHPPTLQNFDSTETINLTSGFGHSVGHHRRHLRKVHGVLNIVGWGTLLPTGVILARYFRKFPFTWQRWYFLHVGSQIVGYILGSSGWAIGLWLGRASRHYTFHTHRLLAIFIFTFTTLQMLALRLRPKPQDEYRKYWDMYHHFLGYALLAVVSVNMFHGIAILKPDHTWKWAYIGVLVVLGGVTLALEVFTWTKFFIGNKKKKDKERDDKAAQDAKSNPNPNPN